MIILIKTHFKNAPYFGSEASRAESGIITLISRCSKNASGMQADLAQFRDAVACKITSLSQEVVK